MDDVGDACVEDAKSALVPALDVGAGPDDVVPPDGSDVGVDAGASEAADEPLGSGGERHGVGLGLQKTFGTHPGAASCSHRERASFG